jgi:5-(carboxyamino)imidazole ribonucleotide synthase
MNSEPPKQKTSQKLQRRSKNMAKIAPGSTIGIIGGGQLGRMTALAAANLGYKVHILCPEENCPASHYCDEFFIADYDDEQALIDFAKSVDVVTFEFENIPHTSVSFLEKYTLVRPSWKALETSQNRIREKDFINSLDIPTAPYAKVTSAQELSSAYATIGTKKAILKTTELGYDGKGQFVIDGNSDLNAIWNESGMKEGVLEGFVPFIKEISVIVARRPSGDSIAFPPAENDHKDSILDISTVPASIIIETAEMAKKQASIIAAELGLEGLLAVEFFVMKDGSLAVNEFAPRPHNSGHWTMDGCMTSQFEQFVRAVCDLPFGPVDQIFDVRMKNLIGTDINNWEMILGDPAAKLHLYGKKEPRPGRKMGHVNYLSPKK